jgi:hypothetical protein
MNKEELEDISNGMNRLIIRGKTYFVLNEMKC